MARDSREPRARQTVVGGRRRRGTLPFGVERELERCGHAHPSDWVLVHDAARPCLINADLDRLLDQLADDPVGGLLAAPVRDTLKQADGTGRVATTVDRSRLWHALTRRCSDWNCCTNPCARHWPKGLLVTDEAAALEAAVSPRLIEGRADNLKITRPEDLALAEFYLARNRGDEGWEQGSRKILCSPIPPPPPIPKPRMHAHRSRFRRTRLRAGRSITLGGSASHMLVDWSPIPMATCCCTHCAMRCWARPVWATSAATFPIAARRSKTSTADSATAGNDAAGTTSDGRQRGRHHRRPSPKMAPHIAAMREHIAADLGIEPDRINVRPPPPNDWALVAARASPFMRWLF